MNLHHRWCPEKLAALALKCAEPSLMKNVIDARAMRILERCITEHTIHLVIKSVHKWRSTKRLLNILSAAVRKQDCSLCMPILEALMKSTSSYDMYSFDWLDYEELKTLIFCIEIFDSEQVHIGILQVMKNLIMVRKLSCKNNSFTANEFRAFQKLLNKWDSNRAYLAVTILALLLQSCEQGPAECDFWAPANEAIVKKFPYLLAADITEDTEAYFTNGIVSRVLQRTHGDGIILWALLATKIFAQKDAKNAVKIKNSECFYFLHSPVSKSSTVKNASENIMFLMNWSL